MSSSYEQIKHKQEAVFLSNEKARTRNIFILQELLLLYHIHFGFLVTAFYNTYIIGIKTLSVTLAISHIGMFYGMTLLQ